MIAANSRAAEISDRVLVSRLELARDRCDDSMNAARIDDAPSPGHAHR